MIEESITSSSIYNSRAESYNFGSDLSKEQVAGQVIRDNIDKFTYQKNTKNIATRPAPRRFFDFWRKLKIVN